MFEGFAQHRVTTTGAEINFRSAGKGPPLLLLHGYPQTHVLWHRMAPDLARRFTVVVPDLRGYGDSSKPPSDSTHLAYSKRVMAQDMVELMARLGFPRFAVAGHDRGGRVAYRMALDHPEVVSKLAVLDIVTTHTMWTQMDKARATGGFHWLFLMQPDGLPETMIGKDPAYYLREMLRRWARPGFAFAPEAMAEYIRCFSDPACIHATCEDYRAGGTIDFELDTADFGKRKITCPVLALWGASGIARRTSDPLSAWRPWADDVRGHAVECGHFLPEEAPEETRKGLEEFL
ncbi:MAG: alpha/beta hydrolase [Alphaproteobacteria bacterium]|nr:alpha/beta hydrolase [Alphaproteobacteria bacterium]